MNETSTMEKIINKLSMFLNEIDKNSMTFDICKKDFIGLKRYLMMMDIPVDIITQKEERVKGSVKLTIEKRG